jgi:hypothetical protein
MASADELRALRTGAQRLHRPSGTTAAGLVRHLTGVQAQNLPSAELALRARGTEPTAASVRAARLDERSVVWTWAMRGTLHLLAAEDVGWLLGLVAPARIRRARGRLAQVGHEGDAPERGVAAIEALLADEGPLTRAELAERLAPRGFRTEGQATVHLLWLAAMRRVICHGPERDGAPAFVLLRDWVPRAPGPRDRDAALAELARRYLAAHAPAGPRDLAAFGGLTVADVRAAWRALAGELHEIEGPEGPLWALRAAPPPAAPPGTVRLLPSFDPYLLGWRDRALALPAEHARKVFPGGGWLHPAVVADGRAVATWRFERRAGRRVEIAPFETLAPAVAAALHAEAADMARFEGRAGEASSGAWISSSPPTTS